MIDLVGKMLIFSCDVQGLCPTALKSVCRRLGIDRWPFQQRRGGIAATRKGKETTVEAQQTRQSRPSSTLSTCSIPAQKTSSPTDSQASEHSDGSSTACSNAVTEPADRSEKFDCEVPYNDKDTAHTPHMISDAVRFDVVANSHHISAPVEPARHTADQWMTFEQRQNAELFPSLFGPPLPWEGLRGEEATSCDMSFLSVRL